MEKKKKEANANSVVAERLRMLRAKANYSQTEIANELGITQQTYSKYESGAASPDSKDIIKLCDLYGVTSDYILGRDKAAGRTATDALSYESALSQDVEFKADDSLELIVQKVIEKMKKENGNK